MQLFKGYTSREINRLSGFPQTKLWQRGFHDHAIRKDEDIKRIARYIVANPLRAGLVEKIEDYPLWDAIWL
jgi:putative transposase